MQEQTKPSLERSLAEAFGETICALELCDNMSGNYSAMVHEMPKVMNSIDKMLIPTRNTYVVSYFYSSFIVYIQHCRMYKGET